MIRSPPRSPVGGPAASTSTSTANTPIMSNSIRSNSGHRGGGSPVRGGGGGKATNISWTRGGGQPISSSSSSSRGMSKSNSNTSLRSGSSPVRGRGRPISSSHSTRKLLQEDLMDGSSGRHSRGGGGGRRAVATPGAAATASPHTVVLGSGSTASAIDMSSSSGSHNKGLGAPDRIRRTNTEPISTATAAQKYGYSSRLRASVLNRPSLKWATSWGTQRTSNGSRHTVDLNAVNNGIRSDSDGLGTPAVSGGGAAGGGGLLNWVSGRLSVVQQRPSNALRPEDMYGLQDMDFSQYYGASSDDDILDSDGDVSEIDENEVVEDNNMLLNNVGGFLNQRVETFRNNVDAILNVPGAGAFRHSEHEIRFLKSNELDKLGVAEEKKDEDPAADNGGKSVPADGGGGGGPFSTFRKNMAQMASITKQIVPGSGGGAGGAGRTSAATTTSTATEPTTCSSHGSTGSLSDLYNLHDAEAQSSCHGGVISNPQDNSFRISTTFTRNMNTIARTIKEGGDIDIVVDEEDASRSATTFQRNINTIARCVNESRDQLVVEKELGVTEFLKCRVHTLKRNMDFAGSHAKDGTETFGKNMYYLGSSFRGVPSRESRHGFVKPKLEFAQEAAESIAHDLATLETFSKNMTFVSSEAQSMAKDIRHLETFSKNVDFAQSKTESMTREIGKKVQERVPSSMSSVNPQENSESQ